MNSFNITKILNYFSQMAATYKMVAPRGNINNLNSFNYQNFLYSHPLTKNRYKEINAHYANVVKSFLYKKW